MKNYRQRKLASRILGGGRKLLAVDTSGLKIVVSKKGTIDFCEDSYEHGELAEVSYTDFDVRGIYNSPEELVKAIQSNTGMYYGLEPSDFGFYDGAIETSDLVDKDNSQPSEEQKELWRKGELKLYAAYLWLPVEVVSDRHEMTEEEAKAFGFTHY